MLLDNIQCSGRRSRQSEVMAVKVALLAIQISADFVVFRRVSRYASRSGSANIASFQGDLS
ncbi:hypothetical protein [Xanthomonas sp. MUS 060]|uniref:hypothetical protein n=1 Tax=Xanthomonas sp. MUS 060 TaxID=1588031 RepID=UPI0013792099|nr:hypothetical protein [Xanthomonas sp. MUS 060]